jgi:hypothetical protein
MIRKRITDDWLTRLLWEYDDDLPFCNKASYLLGDLTNYGVSQCKKLIDYGIVQYEFYIYKDGDSVISLIVELPIDFSLKDLEKALVFLLKYDGMITSNDRELFNKWDKQIKPKYLYAHAKYSANKFLEALRRILIF